MYPEERVNWGHAVYRHGVLLHTGVNPIPNEVRDQATEIRWLEIDPEGLVEEESTQN